MVYLILLFFLLNTPTISLMAKSLLFLLLTSTITIWVIENMNSMLNAGEKVGMLTMMMLTTIMISQNLATPWIMVLMEIQTYIMLSSSSWLKGTPKNSFNEACMTYVFPAAFSTFTMFGGFLLYLHLGLNSLYPSMLISLALLMKMGAVPFYTWVKTVYGGISWSAIMVLGMLNKVGVVMMLTYNMPSGYSMYLLVGIFSILVGSMMASNQVGLKELWGFSGVSSMGLIMILMFMASKTNYSNSLIYTFNQEMMMFLVVYALSLLPFMAVMNTIGLNNQNSMNFYLHKINKSTIQSYILIISLLSMAGMPPFAGFAIKFMLLSEMSNLGTGSLAMVILFLSLPLMMAYLSLVSKLTRLEPSTYYYNLNQQKVSLKLSSLAMFFSLVSLLISMSILLHLI